MITEEVKKTIIKVLNCFETGKPDTDYISIFLYRDGENNTKQVTLGRGYTEAGSLWAVFQYYKDMGGANGSKLLSYKNQKGKQTLPYNKTFLNLIIDSAKNDPLFRAAQDKAFDVIYWNKGMKFFNDYKFTTPLSLMAIQDSILHSGSMMDFLLNRFAESKPSSGGDEKQWIEDYCRVRRAWLYGKGGILRNTVYRMDFMQAQISKNNWDLKTPLYANGVKII